MDWNLNVLLKFISVLTLLLKKSVATFSWKRHTTITATLLKMWQDKRNCGRMCLGTSRLNLAFLFYPWFSEKKKLLGEKTDCFSMVVGNY